ncbi:MAG: hypothetical protein IJY58_05810 [Alphaproteobacteria bacterium]|nr:hypothetical protein [Alphaproteobacteria bacterium]
MAHLQQNTQKQSTQNNNTHVNYNNCHKDMETIWEKTKDVAGDAWEATKEGTSTAWEATKEASKNAWEAAKEPFKEKEKEKEISPDSSKNRTQSTEKSKK